MALGISCLFKPLVKPNANPYMGSLYKAHVRHTWSNPMQTLMGSPLKAYVNLKWSNPMQTHTWVARMNPMSDKHGQTQSKPTYG